MGWCLTIIAMALFCTVTVGTPISTIVGFEFLVGAGGGTILAATYFPVLAPIPISSMAHALNFFGFGRQFATASLIGYHACILLLMTHIDMVRSNRRCHPSKPAHKPHFQLARHKRSITLTSRYILPVHPARQNSTTASAERSASRLLGQCADDLEGNGWSDRNRLAGVACYASRAASCEDGRELGHVGEREEKRK